MHSHRKYARMRAPKAKTQTNTPTTQVHVKVQGWGLNVAHNGPRARHRQGLTVKKATQKDSNKQTAADYSHTTRL